MDTRFSSSASRHNLRQGRGLVPIFFPTKATTHPGSLETWLLERLLKRKGTSSTCHSIFFIFLRTSFLSLGIFDTFLLHNIIVSLFFFPFDFCFFVGCDSGLSLGSSALKLSCLTTGSTLSRVIHHSVPVVVFFRPNTNECK
jgi:hypothetical protein